jgi:gluconolactonase
MIPSRFVFAALFATLSFATAQDMPLSQVLIDGENWELVAEGYEFTDGLSTDAEGNLYFSDVKGGNAVYRVDLEGKVSEFITDAPGISGLKWGADGRLYACVSKDQKVVVFSKEGERTELVSDVKPNDLVVTHDGNVYFTMTPTSEIRRIDPSGNMTVVSQGDVTKPNGITLSRDQGTLAVSDHGGKYVWVFRIEADGSLNYAQNYMTMQTPVATPDIARGDGMTTDIHGRYYVTTAMGLQMFDPTGRMGGVIAPPNPGLPVVSTCFAGPGHAYLYIANGGTIYRRKTLTSGALSFEEPKGDEAPPK